MRRGKLDKISIIYIIIAAIFAVISFSLDQMVIQTEDKKTKKNVMYQKAMFDFHQHTDMGLSFRALQNLIHEEAEFLSFKNEFYLNVLGGFILRPDYYKENFYIIHNDKPFYNELTEFMSSGRCMVLVLEKENAVEEWRDTIGATNPEQAGEGTIRNLYADSLSKNAVHGSDSLENAAIEVRFFFP